MTATADRDRLLELLRTKSYERRKVKLASGKESDFYIDCKRVTLDAEGSTLVGRELFERIRKETPDAKAVGGPTLGADPIGTAVSLTSFLKNFPIPAYIVRKEPKGHGTGQWIEGTENIPKGAKVVLVEDVVTSGGSSLKAIQHVREAGYTVSDVYVLVDREEGGRENLEKEGVKLHALYRKGDFVK